MANFEKLIAPSEGQRITFIDGNPVVQEHPIIPFIRGDGTGIDIWPATQLVIDKAIEKAYGSIRRPKNYFC